MADPQSVAERLRARSVRLDTRQILVTDFRQTAQKGDLTEPPNCGGVGRLRHFRRMTSEGWPSNPLPTDPASRALGLGHLDMLRVQLFQNAACNWRCWYCYVPFPQLAARPETSQWLTPTELVERYLNEDGRPPVLVLSGGQPDLVPEWVPWTMEALEQLGVSDRVYLWSDDNLSTDFVWKYLTDADRKRMSSYHNYGRVGCFKGFNETSFAFNTKASPDQYAKQFTHFARLATLGVDLYAYVTFTTPPVPNVRDDIRRFVDALQVISEELPLRTVPLCIQEFGPTRQRMSDERRDALKSQFEAVDAWVAELEDRFSPSLRAREIGDVPRP
jgi:uncharacterized Fe-S cluster-containing radical SAM superfamily protein